MNKFEKSLRFIKQSIQPDSPFYAQIYLVGGCVRDELLGERYSDLDLLLNMPNGQKQFVEYMCSTYPDVCKGPFYYQRYGTTAMDVIIDGSLTLVECVEPHVEAYEEDGVTLKETRFCSLEEDSSRRDYTCNALYKNLHTGKVLDPTGRGIDDLKAGLLITPGDPAVIYKQDPVRMLRGIRFKHQKGFSLDPDCWQAIIDNHDTMAVSAPKRLRDELNKLLKCRSFGEGINDLYITGLLTYVMPGISEYIGDTRQLAHCEPGTTSWDHTRAALEVLTREHPHTETLYKLATLVMDIAVTQGRSAAAEILVNAGIGREKVVSILHITELYQRFSKMFEGSRYIARPRELPRFKNGLAKHLDDFRRMVRALNQKVLPEHQLPWRMLFDENYVPKQPMSDRKVRTGSRRRPATPAGNVTDLSQSQAETLVPAEDAAAAAATERKRKRNIKRRELRKRVRSRKRQEKEALAAAPTDNA